MWRNLSRSQKLLTAAAATGSAVYLYEHQKQHQHPLGLLTRKVAYAEANIDQQQRRPVNPWQAPSRQEMLNRLKTEKEFDLLIVGGGATGTGTAVDAATRGLNVALVERDDFASGVLLLFFSFFLVQTFLTRACRYLVPINKVGARRCTVSPKSNHGA